MAQADYTTMLCQNVTIVNKLGLHARAASKFIACTCAYSADVQIEVDGKIADGKSIMSVMMLAASVGSTLTITCDGIDEHDAMTAIVDLIDRKFDEEQ